MITGVILVLSGGIVVGSAIDDTWQATAKATLGLFCVMAGTFLVGAVS